MNPNMIKKLQQMQRDMVKAQKELEASIFYGSAGGQAVKVEFNGAKEMQRLTITPDAFDLPEDFDLLQETVIAAVNDCMKKIDEETQATMGQFSQGLGNVPGLF
ncbi:MAG: YbaB/EbfC family nucleoid-associated protein [Acholeplasmatales bacterium]|nr:MAG: YbaB/EbfC family nucleoid-associated protein [Acholeplasmatales bacterium]